MSDAPTVTGGFRKILGQRWNRAGQAGAV